MNDDTLKKIAEDCFLLAFNIRGGDLEEEIEEGDDDLAIHAKREWRAMELVIGIGERVARVAGIADEDLWKPEGLEELIQA